VNVPGRTAVWIFFGISGYVIAYGFLRRRYLIDGAGLKHFYLNRFLRIYPLFLLLSVLGWLTIWANSGVNPLEWRDLPGQFFGLQFDHAYKLNGVFWTLGLEIQFYAMAPALVILFLSRMFGGGGGSSLLVISDCLRSTGRPCATWAGLSMGEISFRCFRIFLPGWLAADLLRPSSAATRKQQDIWWAVSSAWLPATGFITGSQRGSGIRAGRFWLMP
jgi:peptidoglycan/LPS O-acetylase OafA/YrhL